MHEAYNQDNAVLVDTKIHLTASTVKLHIAISNICLYLATILINTYLQPANLFADGNKRRSNLRGSAGYICPCVLLASFH